MDPLKLHILTLQLLPEPTVTPLQLKNPDPDSTESPNEETKAGCSVAAAVVVHAALHVTRWPNHHNRVLDIENDIYGNRLDYRQRQLVGGGNSNIFYFQPYLRKIPILAI